MAIIKKDARTLCYFRYLFRHIEPSIDIQGSSQEKKVLQFSKLYEFRLTQL